MSNNRMDTTSKFIIDLDTDKCTGCFLCLDLCPNKLLRPSEIINFNGFQPAQVIDAPYCLGCEACYLICPHNAIKLVPVDKDISITGTFYWLGRQLAKFPKLKKEK